MRESMSDVIFRETTPKDTEQLIGLWCTVFRDPPELVETFLSLLPEMGIGCVADSQRQILGAAYLIDGFTLLQPGKLPVRCGYLYAVAADPAVRGRGLGSALSCKAAELGRLHGAELICTLPAEHSLYSWYGRVLSLTNQTSRRRFFTSLLPEGVQTLSPSAYLLRREALLEGTPHILPNNAAMEFEAALCRACGGGLYAFGDAVFCAYREGTQWVIPEYLPQSAAETVPGLRAESSLYLCSDLPLPDRLVWNLTFD